MSTRKYTDEHEWIDVDGDLATIGISDYAQGQLGDIVFVELPATGRTLAQGDEAAVIESVKAASELYAPIDGEVAEPATQGALHEDRRPSIGSLLHEACREEEPGPCQQRPAEQRAPRRAAAAPLRLSHGARSRR